MENKFSDGPHNLKNEKRDEESRWSFSQKDDSSSIKENLYDKDQIRDTSTYTEKEENVAENLEGVNNIEEHLINTTHNNKKDDDNHLDFKDQDQNQFHQVNYLNDNNALLDTDKKEFGNSLRQQQKKQQSSLISVEPSTPEEIVRDWENLHNISLSKKLRKFALLIAAIHLDNNSGITVQDIQVLTNCRTINAAEKRRDDAVKMGLIVSHESLKDGKQKVYFLSNYIHIFNEKIKRKSAADKEPHVSPDDITLALIKVLSSRKCAYHHISLRTNLKYPKEDYGLLDTTSNWIIKSLKNNTKIATFKLEDRRNCTLNVSQNGTVMISIECTTNQYKLHTYEGIAELFISCGQVMDILQQEAGYRLNVVPHPLDWKILQFDNDKTISIEELKKEYPNINWHSKAGLTLRSVGTAFRMYVKEMPEQGSCLRTELNNSFKDSKTLSEKTKEIAKGDDVEYTPDDFIRDRLSERKDRSMDNEINGQIQ